MNGPDTSPSGSSPNSDQSPETDPVPSLVLELRQGESMVINGAHIRFRTKARLELTTQARFLFGKQIMSPEAADTPARRLYLALQSVYVGTDEERVCGLENARVLTAALVSASTSALTRATLEHALAAAEADECYLALQLARRVIRHEDALLGAGEQPKVR